MHRGSTVKCICNLGIKVYLTEGNFYEVERKRGKYIWVKANTGKLERFMLSRFETV